MRRILFLGLVLGGLIACDDGLGPADQANLTIAFATVPGSGTAAAPAAKTPLQPTAITVAGSNGTLTITEIWVIVDEFELEGSDEACDPVDGDDEADDCADFESAPALVSIPVDDNALDVITGPIPLGTYSELEWEVEDIDLDDADEDETELDDVAGAIEARFGAGVWPTEASMAVIGTFDDGETVTPFTTFFDAEIEVEVDLVPPLEITQEGASRELTIVLAPSMWFQLADGSVLNLAQYGDEVAEFELEFENGIFEIERDDDDDDDDDDD